MLGMSHKEQKMAALMGLSERINWDLIKFTFKPNDGIQKNQFHGPKYKNSPELFKMSEQEKDSLSLLLNSLMEPKHPLKSNISF